MKNSLKRALPGCLGACVGVFLVETLRHLWLWERVRGKKPPESR